MRKNAIIGLIIGILIGISATVYADVFNFSISGTIIIPSSTLVEINGLTVNYDGTYSFNDMILSGDRYKENFYMRNKGSADVQVTYTAETPDTNLSIHLEAYVSNSDTDTWHDNPTITIPRGQTAKIIIVVQDQGATEGTHGFQVTIEATG